MVSRKTCFFFSIVLSLLISTDLVAARSKPRIITYKGTEGCSFTTSYILHTPSEPSDLQVDMVIENNMSNTIYKDHYWFPNASFFELRFVLNGELKTVGMWLTQDKKLKILDLEEVSFSPWYYAIEKLAHEIGSQRYGLKIQTPEISFQECSSPHSIQIKPIENHKFRSIRQIAEKRRMPRKLIVDVQEELYRGKKRIVASTTFQRKSSIKFIQTKYGLKEISRNGLEESSPWYPYIKKTVQKDIDDFLMYKKRHNFVTKFAPVKKVDPESLKNRKKREFRFCVPRQG